MQTGHNFLCLFNPGNAPTYQAGHTPAQREQTRLHWECNRKDFDLCHRMDLLLKNALEKAIDPIWLAEIHTVEHSFGNRSFLDAIIHLYQKHGSVSPEDLRANADKMDKTFDPNQPIT
eukprot:1421923-Ditylum_brightwellii.AAC.1